MLRTKLIRPETKVVGPGQIRAVVSDESTDRDGDIIRQAGWDLKAFNQHPVLLTSHNYYELRSQIGEWVEMKVQGKRMIGVAQYYIGQGNAEADWGFTLAEKGRAAFSVGFIPTEMEEIDGSGFFGSYEFKAAELLEVSQVTVPANSNALQLMAKSAQHPVMQELVREQLADKTPASDVAKRISLASWGIDQSTGLLTPIELSGSASDTSATIPYTTLAKNSDADEDELEELRERVSRLEEQQLEQPVSQPATILDVVGEEHDDESSETRESISIPSSLFDEVLEEVS